MLSKFGIYIRKIREKKNESLRTMAGNLGISASFLSAMEVGRKNIPLEYVGKISNLYSLTEEEKERLEDSIVETNRTVSIELDKMNEAQKEASLIFARKIKNADSDLIQKLMEVLNSDKN